MLDELLYVHNAFLSAMKAEEGVLGAWYFGSAARGTTDKYSDIDIVFLIEKDSFSLVDCKLTKMLSEICDEVVLCWPEEFNTQSIKNYGYVLQKNQHLLQYDVFLLNKEKIDNFMCKIHYMDLQMNHIVFDKDDNVKALVKKDIKGEPWQSNIQNLIKTYWYHIQMSAKYFARNDFFKLNTVLRILMDTHSSLLLTAYDKITWGSSANKLHFIAEEKQKHLMQYGCFEDFALIKNNLMQALEWFNEDIREIGSSNEIMFNEKISKTIMNDWIKKTLPPHFS